MNFTGTSIEYMMRSNRAGRMEKGSDSKSLPETHPCYGCSYAKETSCIGYCIKKLMKKEDRDR